MIAYVDGIVENVEPDNVVVDVGGMGFNVKISEATAQRLPGCGMPVKLYTYTCVREDAFQLYGFLSRDELRVFKLCLTVSGIGPKGGLALLSALDADSLRLAIMSGDVKAISRAPGIGKRTAERLVLELKGKISMEELSADRQMAELGGKAVAADSPQKREAIEALTALGYGQADAMRAVSSIEGIENMDSGAVLKAALKKMI